MLEEADKRDHRKLGKQLGIFMLSDYGPGFPFFLPNGMILRNTLIDYWREVHRKYGYYEVMTPMIMNRQLWEMSGHWDHYKENMYFTKIDGEDYAVKPMNCPGGMIVYKTKNRSPIVTCHFVPANWALCTVMSCPVPFTACSGSVTSLRMMLISL